MSPIFSLKGINALVLCRNGLTHIATDLFRAWPIIILLSSNIQSIMSFSENSVPVSISIGVPPRLLPYLGDNLMPAEIKKRERELYWDSELHYTV